MPTNPLDKYASFGTDTKIKFIQITQSQLNGLITSGGATEGAFYLTTDTHKLYVGRKNSLDSKNYPEQVSRGVTVVGTSSELPTPPANAPAGAIEEGELFYITDTNVLAALRKKRNLDGSLYDPLTYEWIQINPPTGITDINTNTTTVNTTDVQINTTVSTAAGNSPVGSFVLKAGDNIDLTSVTSPSSATKGEVIIAATDTLYQIGTTTGTTSAILGLKINSETSITTAAQVILSSTNTVAVTSDNNNNITIAGPSFTGFTITPKTTTAAPGFDIALNGNNGDGTEFSDINGTINPVITYGQTSTTAVFINGIANLNVYTTTETTAAINNAIENHLAAANALTYRGSVDGVTAIIAAISANGAHIGDVYKVTSNTSGWSVGSQSITPSIGDLIILNSTTAENSSGEISFTTIASLLSSSDLIPSGDEPEIKGATSHGDGSTNTPAIIQLVDGKTDDANVLKASFYSSDKIAVSSLDNDSVTSGIGENITISHKSTTRTDSISATLASATATDVDTIGLNKYKFLVLSGNSTSAIQTDIYGHVTGLSVKEIIFEHNAINGNTITYSGTTNNSYGQYTLELSDKIESSIPAISLKIASDNLKIQGDNTNKQFNINLVWESFTAS